MTSWSDSRAYDKGHHVPTQPKTASCNKSVDIFNNFLQQADIRMRSHGLQQLVKTSLLQVVNRLVTSWLFQKACCNLFQQIVTSLQMASCNKPDLTIGSPVILFSWHSRA